MENTTCMLQVKVVILTQIRFTINRYFHSKLRF